MLKKIDYNEKKTRIYLTLLCCLVLLTGFRFFYKLGTEVVHHTDEAWHAVNVYEMYESGNWIVPTQHYKADYHSKPPLNLWADLVFFRVLGPSELALRLPSAIAGFLTYLVLIGYLLHYNNLQSAVFMAAVFPALRECFRFHMFRTGDMDAMFGQFFVLAILALHRVGSGNGKMLKWAALSTSLAFLVKTSHIAVIIIIGLCYLPRMYRHLSKRNIMSAVLFFTVPVLVWVALRYPYDGLAYFKAIIIGEAVEKTQELFTTVFLKDIINERVTWILLAVLTIRGACHLIIEGTQQFGKRLIKWLGRNYLMLLVIVCPIVFYTIAGATLNWYVYPSYFGITMLIATQSAEIMNVIGISQRTDKPAGLRRFMRAGFAICVLGICVLYTLKQMQEYRNAGQGGLPLQQFRSDLYEYLQENGDINRGKPAYVAYNRNRYYGDTGHWEQPYLFYGYVIGGFDCREGGVEGFLQDEDAIIILDKELWETYADVLTGHVFLEQNTFCILNHDYY